MSEHDIQERIVRAAAAQIAREMRQIVPERVYTPEEAAELIGIRSARGGKTIREFAPEILPSIPVTPQGGRIGYYGRDLIAFVRGQRPKQAPPLEDVA